MEVPSSVGPLAQRWDEEQIGLASAARTIRGAATGGFTADVAAEAAAFTTAWERFAADEGTECGRRGDALRDTVADVDATDQAVARSFSGQFSGQALS